MHRDIENIELMSYKIIVVDDESDFEELVNQKFRQKIRQGEFQFIFASNGVEALEKVQDNLDLDLVLTDINMPQMDGLTLLSKLNKIEAIFKTVVVSAYGDMNNIRIAMNAGACDFLIKPINLQDLEITIKKNLKQVQSLKESHKQLRLAQFQLIQSEKMSIIGQMLSGIAHEINNPVGSVSANLIHVENYLQDCINLLKRYRGKFPDPGAEIADQVDKIDLDYLIEDSPKIIKAMREGTNRIQEITTSLKTFARADTVHKVPLAIHEGIDSTLLILKHRLKANKNRPEIEVMRNYENLPPILCYPGQIKQVLMNLIGNAIDALDEANRGKTYADIQAAPNTIAIQTKLVEDGSAIAISIADNGSGMSEDVKARIFDRLFTTKPIGQGTGLGLSISRQIIEENHGGRLTCSSTPGVGTQFKIVISVGRSHL
jgi:two-component system, NtrC family, sensor kinase